MDNRTDADKMKSEYFSHWEYTGNGIQKRLQTGPRQAIYKAISEKDATALAQAGETIDAPVMVTGTKAITFQEFSRQQAQKSAFHLVKRSPWALRCIDIRAKSLASIPWDVWEGDSPVEDTHPYKQLLIEVNPEMNNPDLLAATESDLNVFGQAFWKKIGGGPSFLQRINPAMMKVISDDKGVAGFQQTPDTTLIPRNKVIFFHNYDPENDFGGLSPLNSVKDPLEVEIAANEHLKDFFDNRAMPDLIMSLETNNTNEIKRIADQWKREFSGSGKQHKTGWVGGGAEPNEIGYAPRDLALAEVREEARRQICAGFGVPPALVAAWEAANYATIREQRQSLYTEVLFPEARYMAGVINAELSPLFGDVEFRWDFTKVDAMQDTEDARTKRLVWLVDGRVIKPEVAALELGYDSEDVPEPLPVPEFGGSADNNNNIGRASSPPPTSDDRKTENALRKWRRKALNRLRDGKDALCNFESEFVAPILSDAIKVQLENAKTPEEVHDVFEDAWLIQA